MTSIYLGLHNENQSINQSNSHSINILFLKLISEMYCFIMSISNAIFNTGTTMPDKRNKNNQKAYNPPPPK